jgi:pimeloyl-ACP methyl ester carboxylesterase
VGFDYPSTRIPIERSAEYLHHVIESLEGIEEIHLVAHSLGGLVTRAYLKEHRDPRIKRLMMLGVPNQGAEMANLLRRNYAFRIVYGPAGQQLATDADGLIPQLPVPDFEFAVIAGSSGKRRGFNPLITGDDDLVVSVESARLPGAVGFRTVRALHGRLPSNREVIQATLDFLATGRLDAVGPAAT